jgi:phage-related minor tail protein
MIAQYIAIGIARKFAGLGSGGGGGSVESFTGGFTSDPSAYARMGLSAFSNVQYRASGGPVAGGSPYVVGEKGPELFVPGRSGTVVPNDAMGGEVNSVVNINISDSGTSVDAKNAGKIGRMIESSTMAILTSERRPGGLLTR